MRNLIIHGYRNQIMAKLGDEYQDLVGLVREALDPDATVKVGEWIVGPDGRRDMDVEVRGMTDGIEQFILVECKDWRRKVGIQTVDALESKRRDLGADLAVIYSNSGFSQPALRKARRVGIQAFSALKEKDKRVKISLSTEFIVKRLSVDTYTVRVFFEKNTEIVLKEGWTPSDIKYYGCPIVNFLHSESLEILKSIETSKHVKITYAFTGPQEFEIAGDSVLLIGIEVVLHCRLSWLSQEVQTGVTLGQYDHLKKKIIIPNKQSYYIGTIDQEKWEPVDKGWKEEALEPNSFELRLTLMNPVAEDKNAGIPSLSKIIADKAVEHEEI